MSWISVAREQFQEVGEPDGLPTNFLTTEDYTQGVDKPLCSYGDPEKFKEALDAVQYFYSGDDGADVRIRTWIETVFFPEGQEEEDEGLTLSEDTKRRLEESLETPRDQLLSTDEMRQRLGVSDDV